MNVKSLCLATALATVAFATAARADVMITDSLSGTGDNVVFDSISGSVAFGSFNGPHPGFAQFTDLSGNSSFTGAANGNDIKISNTSDLNVALCSDKTNCSGTPLATATDVFSLKGTGSVTATVIANESGGGTKTFTFTLGAIDPNAQSGFTLTAINGETISNFTLLDTTTGGVITDFEHYRVDVAAVPGPIVGAGIPGLIAALGGMVGLNRFRRKRRVA